MIESPTVWRAENIGNHAFEEPVKRIHDGADVAFFLTSLAYRDIVTFILQLNRSLVPRKAERPGDSTVQSWPSDSGNISFSEPVGKLRLLLTKLNHLLNEAPPDTGPRRFGNVSFRRWHQLASERSRQLLDECLGSRLKPAFVELESYLLGSFGSPQRLDYGTGHELSFIAFLGCLWKLDFFANAEPGVEERGIVLGIVEPYLDLARALIKTYTLEPAGSHGVWGLDDNSFLPYMFGSAQLSPPISETDETPIEGSIANAPDPGSVAKANLVEKEKAHNMYFSAIAFIYDVKKGPFWEHSPMLYDISGIKDGWGKINKGMIKMYNAEVLSKFPVVQHFTFGSLFKWEKDPQAKPPPTSTHTSSQPLRNPVDSHAPNTARTGGIQGPPGVTGAPWAGRAPQQPIGFVNGVTQAPWARSTTARPQQGSLQAQAHHPVPTIQEDRSSRFPKAP